MNMTEQYEQHCKLVTIFLNGKLGVKVDDIEGDFKIDFNRQYNQINQVITIGDIDYLFDSDFRHKSLSIGSFCKVSYTSNYFGMFNLENNVFYPNK